MTNQAAVSDNYIVSKIIQALYPKGTVPTAEELLEKVDQIALENRRNNQLDSVKSVRGWKQVEMCSECGTTSTLEEINRTHPTALSCCPERHMVPTMVPANYGNVAEAATRNFVQNVGDILRCPSTVNDYPQILSALHDVIDNSNKKSAEIQALQKDLDGVSRTLRIVNGAVDSLVELVGAKDPGDMRHKIAGMMDRCRVLDEADESGLMRKAVFLPVGLDMFTADLISNFAENLGQRLHEKQRQGYTGWSRDDWKDDCLRRLHTSDKPLDVAAFAVFAWHHGWKGSYEGLIELTPGTIESTTPPVQNTHITINVETAGIADAVRLALESASVRQVEPGFVSTGFVIPEGFTDDQRAELAEVLDTAILRISKQAPGFRTE